MAGDIIIYCHYCGQSYYPQTGHACMNAKFDIMPIKPILSGETYKSSAVVFDPRLDRVIELLEEILKRIRE